MARGKYAVKSANRLAQLDNELIQQAKERIAELERENLRLRQQVDAARRPVDSEVLSRAEKLSAVIEAKVVAESEKRAAEIDRCIDWAVETMMAHFKRSHSMPAVWMRDVLPVLVPDQKKRSQLLDTFITESREQ